MAPEVLDAAIRQLVSSRLDRPRLALFGGEPLLVAPLVRRALDRVRKWAPPRMRPDIQIVTNGTRLDEEMARLLVSRDVSILLSFDGVGPAQDDRGPGSFEQLDRLLVRLNHDHPKLLRERLAVKVTLTSRNVPFLSASFRYFLSRGVRDVDIYPVLPDDAGWSAQSRRDLDRQLAEVVRLSVEEFRRSGQVPFRPFRGAAAEPPADGAPACACGSRGLLFIDVDGALAPCSLLVPSTLGSQPKAIRRVVATLGGLHVTDPDLPDALLRRERRAHRLRFLAGPAGRQGPRGACAQCKAGSTCFVCPVAVACNGGRVPAFHCDVNRLFARHRAAFAARASSPTAPSDHGAVRGQL
jgi:sulfatase maturation enzyme AslB (radical SAM superfamily)